MNRRFTAAAFVLLAATAFARFPFRSSDTKPADSQASAAADSATTATRTAAPELEWSTDLQNSLARARTSGKPVLIDFFATWCPPCQMMERTTFRDQDVKSRLQNYELVRIDVDRSPELARDYGVQGLPTLMCVKPSGDRTTEVGYLSAKALLKMTEQCGATQPAKGS